MSSFALTDVYEFNHYLRRSTPAKAVVTPSAVELCPPQTPATQHQWLGFTAAALLALAAHLAVQQWLEADPAPIVAAQVPPMTVQLLRPQPVEPVKPVPKQQVAPVKPAPVKPVPKKVQPVAVKPTPVQPTPVQPAPVQPVTAPVQTAPVDVAPPVFTPAVADADYLQNPAPVYPDSAVEQGWEGTVLLNVHVLPNGRADAIEIKNSSGRKVLDNAAVATVTAWQFVPAKRGEQHVDSWVEVPIEFALSQG